MSNFSREFFQDIYHVILLITYQKHEGGGEVSWILWLDSSHKDLNSYEFFKLLLASDIFRLALLFAFFS